MVLHSCFHLDTETCAVIHAYICHHVGQSYSLCAHLLIETVCINQRVIADNYIILYNNVYGVYDSHSQAIVIHLVL